MRISRLFKFFIVLSFVFCIAIPSYSASATSAEEDSADNSTEETSDAYSESEAALVEYLTGETVDNVVSNDVVEEKKKSEKAAKKQKKQSKKKSQKEIQNERNNFSGWVAPRGRAIDETFGALKLRLRNKIGSFNVAIVDEESKKTIPVLSTSDEYTTSGFYLKVGKKIIELNKDSSVRRSAWKTEDGAAVGYRIDNLADVIVYFDVFRSSGDFDVDSLKITVKVTNMSKKKEFYAIKVLLDTILGETDRHHFYDSNNNPVRNEVSYRDLEDNKWFLSKNSTGALQIIFGGGDCTKPELVALANYSTLNTRNWEPDLLSYRAFDTVMAYNNSAVGIIWPRHKLGADEQFTEVFYLSTAFGERIPSGAAFLLGIEPEEKVKPEEVVVEPEAEETSKVEAQPVKEQTKQEEPTTNVPPYVPFDVKTLTSQQLSPEYIQDLLNRIAALEDSDDSVNREELLQLNAELDTILEALRL